MSKPPFKKGDEIGAYTIDGIFSMGGMGVVYKVKGGNVLIKSPFADSDPEIIEQFQEEVEALKKLEHPGIVKILGASVYNNIPWYAMQKLEGENLRERLNRERKLSCTEALRIEFQIVQSMAYAHSRDKPVWHRDLKPDNICFQNRRPIILDFGLARFGTNSSVILSPHGTLLYMAPEQIRGHTDGRTDVYALGVILYEMLSGRTPYLVDKNESDSSVIERILNLDDPCPVLPDEVDGSITSICDKSLSKRPEFRYADATEMVADIKFALRKQLKKDAIQLEQNKNYRVAAELLREAVEYGLPMIELEEFWKFRIGKSLKVVLIDHSSIDSAKKALRLKNHPYLIPILEVIEGKHPYLVVESLTSDPLTRRISQGNYLSFSESVALCQAVYYSLEAAKEENLALPVEERRIFPGEKFRIAGMHRMRIGYREVSARHLAQILIRGLCGALEPVWEDFPDIFRDVLQKAKSGNYTGDAIVLAKEIEAIWNDQEKHLQEIENLKNSLDENFAAPNPEIVDRLVSLFLGDYRETVREKAKQVLEEAFVSDSNKATETKTNKASKPEAGITEKIASFVGTVFQANGAPEISFGEEQDVMYAAEFVRFFENAIASPPQLTPKKAEALFAEFLRNKIAEAGQSLEQERLRLESSCEQKDKTIEHLEREVKRLEEALSAKDDIIFKQDQSIQDLKSKPPAAVMDQVSRDIGASLASSKSGTDKNSQKIAGEIRQAICGQLLWHLKVIIAGGEQILYQLLGERSSLTAREQKIENKIQEILSKTEELKKKVESPQYTAAAESVDSFVSYLVIAEYIRHRFFEIIKRNKISQNYGNIHILLQ